MNLESLEHRRMLVATSVSGTVINITTGGGTTNDIVTMNVSAGTLTVMVNNGGVVEPAFILAGAAYTSITSFNISLGTGNDTLTMNTTILKPASVLGGSGNDTITGGNGNDTILSGQNNDSVVGGAGNDLIDGGGGNDTIAGGSGNDTLDFSLRSTQCVINLVTGAAGEVSAAEADVTSAMESILGGGGADSLTGSALADYISGGGGNDTIFGGVGNDTIVGGSGQDTMYGNDGNDFLFALDGEIDYVDGGPGTDSCQSDPAEAMPAGEVFAAIPPGFNIAPLSVPVTAAPAKAAAPKPIVAPAKPGPFSIQRIEKRPPARATPAKKSTPISAAKSLAAAVNGALPGPVNFSGDEKLDQDPDGFPELTAQQIVTVGAKLEPYAFGIVNTTRNFQGTVTVNGTPGDDVFVIQTTPGSQGVQITNNGGFVEFLLASNPINVNGMGGNDQIVIDGGGANGAVSYAPGSAPGSGTIFSGGHTINYANTGSTPFSFANVGALTLITPGQVDTVHIGTQASAPDAVAVDVSSGNQTFPTIVLNGVALLTLDLGKNDVAGASNDHVTFDTPVTVNVSILPGTLGVDDVVVNSGQVILATGMASPDPATAPTVSLAVNSGAGVRFDADLTRLNAFTLTGQAAILKGGGKVLLTRGLDINGAGRLDLLDNSFIHDYNGNAVPPGGPPVRGYIVSAYQAAAAQHWNGPGIYSSLLPTDTAKSLGYADSAQLYGAAGGTFFGVPVDSSATLVTFTLAGDANLDRKVDFNDLVKLAQNYNVLTARDWFNGDFTFEGATDFNDLVKLAQNYNTTLVLS